MWEWAGRRESGADRRAVRAGLRALEFGKRRHSRRAVRPGMAIPGDCLRLVAGGWWRCRSAIRMEELSRPGPMGGSGLREGLAWQREWRAWWLPAL